MEGIVEQISTFVAQTDRTRLLAGGVVSLLTLNWLKKKLLRPKTAPPHVSSWVPWFGSIAAFGQNPIDFLLKNYLTVGPVFSFTMFGTEVTYLLGSEASAEFWSSHNDVLNAEDLYANLTVPVFGKGVAYDVPHKVFSEQKAIAKTGLTLARFEKYTAMIEKETNDYIKRWGDSGTCDLFHDISELIIFTATRCLHGLEVRSQFNEDVAQLYHDLDKGFTPLAWFLPAWLPFPSFRIRDRAHIELVNRFKAIIRGRRESGNVEGHDDMLETFMTSHYEKVLDGRPFNETETAGMLLALLLAGQHSSSTVTSWLGFFIAADPELQKDIVAEQARVLGPNPGPLTIANVNNMKHLWACVRETLRLRPPLLTLMRRCRTPFKVVAKGREFVIPKGNQVCVSPTLNGRLPDEWDEPEKFDYRRFIRVENGEEVVTDAMGAGEKGGKFRWVPFGAGRHRCIGFEFAQIQVRTIMSTILRSYEIHLPPGQFPEIDFTTMLHCPKNSSVVYTRRKASA
eukprot:m.223878 g.223878  ORF g.223878 m.223878 type:complete len:511 (-) comp16344_c0_seq1:445-1977(-)